MIASAWAGLRPTQTHRRAAVPLRSILIATAAFAIALALVGPASAQSFVRFQNKWKADQHLHIEFGDIQSGPIEQGWWSAMWALVPVANGECYRLQNHWKPEQHVHIEYGALISGPVEGGWWSAMWTLEQVGDGQHMRLRNRWKTDQYIHIEYGQVQAGPIEPGWWSAQWRLGSAP